MAYTYDIWLCAEIIVQILKSSTYIDNILLIKNRSKDDFPVFLGPHTSIRGAAPSVNSIEVKN